MLKRSQPRARISYPALYATRERLARTCSYRKWWPILSLFLHLSLLLSFSFSPSLKTPGRERSIGCILEGEARELHLRGCSRMRRWIYSVHAKCASGEVLPRRANDRRMPYFSRNELRPRAIGKFLLPIIPFFCDRDFWWFSPRVSVSRYSVRVTALCVRRLRSSI